MALSGECDVCILAMLVICSGRSRIQTTLFHHKLAGRVQVTMATSQGALHLISGRVARRQFRLAYLLLLG